MPTVTVAYSERDGDIFTASLRDVAYAAYNVFTGGGLMSSLVGFVNQAIISAEVSQPEGTRMEMVINGWSNPVTGTDYSEDAANWLNGQWSAGNVKGEEGTPITPWPEYPDQVAWGGGNQVVLRWVKMQIGGPFLILYLVAGLVALAIILNWIGNFLKPWQMSATPPSGGGGGTTPSWWDRLSFGEKALIVCGGVVATFFIVWFLAERSIAEAGAPKQTFVIGGEVAE